MSAISRRRGQLLLDRSRRRAPGLAGWAAATATGALLAVSIGLLVEGAGRGLDITDEGLYLLAADNHQPAAIYASWFGRYTGLLFTAVGHDLTWFRVAGVVLLALAGGLLGVAIARIIRSGDGRQSPALTATIVFGVSAATLINYALFIRTPGYNQLALFGALLAVAGILLLLALEAADVRKAVASGALVAFGCFIASWGKESTGAGLAALALVVGLAPGLGAGRARRRGIIAAVAVGALLMALHLVFIADPATTVRALGRTLEMLAVVDPRYYRVHSAVGLTIRDLVTAPVAIVGSTLGLVFCGLAPLLAFALPRDRRATACLSGTLGALAIVSAFLAVRGQWLGGIAGYQAVAIADGAILATMVLAAASTAIVHRPGRDGAGDRKRRSLAVAAVVLLGAAGAYAFGSNNGIVSQSTGAAVLVLAAAALVAGLPFQGKPRVILVASVCVVMSVAAPLVLYTARDHPYRMAPIAQQTETVRLGSAGPVVALDPASVAYWDRLVTAARAAGWQPGMPLLDLTWSPAVPYVLRATVPDTLVPVIGNYPTADAQGRAALRLSDPQLWSDAWVLVSSDQTRVHPADILESIGRSFPRDYELVVAVRAPGLGLHQELWRPRSPAP